jgi:hypothetical protein
VSILSSAFVARTKGHITKRAKIHVLPVTTTITTTIMKSATASVLLSFIISSLAQKSPPLLDRTGPFYIQLVGSRNASLNGLYINTCHVGAATEVLCIPPSTEKPNPRSEFYLNNTKEYSPNEGMITWNLSPQPGYSSAVVLGGGLTSNIVIPTLGPPRAPDYPNILGFDEKDMMYIPSGFDDSKQWNEPGYNPHKKLYRWAICEIVHQPGGYRYTTFVWTVGPSKTEYEIPCVAVEAKRVKIG